jgi:hypothetical protein
MIVCNLTDTAHIMMRNRDSNHTTDTMTKTYMLMQDHLTNNMMMMQDLLAAHMMRMTSLANSSSPYPSSRATTTPTLTSHGPSRLTRSFECTITPKRRKSPWLPLSLKATPIFGGSK